LQVRDGEVGAFALHVLEGQIRLGWAASGESVCELGSGPRSYVFVHSGKKVCDGKFEAYGQEFGKGDVIHCEAERENGQLRIGFAKNDRTLGMAFDCKDELSASDGLVGAVCGKAFKAAIVSAECMPIEEAPGLEGFREFDPPRSAIVVRDFLGDAEECLLALRTGEMLHVSSDDGEGWMFGFFLDPEDPDDGGWFQVDCVELLDDVHPQSSAVNYWDDAEESNEWEGPSTEAALVGDDWGASPHNTWDAPPAEPPAWDEALVAADACDNVSGNDSWDVPPLQAGDWDAPATGNEGSAAAAPAADHDEGVPGLRSWLRELGLEKYMPAAAEWCQEMGAISLKEVRDEHEDFAETIGLKPLERKRLLKNINGA